MSEYFLKECKCNFSYSSRCAYDSFDTKMNDWIATMNNTRRATVKRGSRSDRARLRGGGGGPGCAMQTTRKIRKGAVAARRDGGGRGARGPPGWLCDAIMLTKLFHCSAVYSDARIKAAEQWGGRDGESSEIGTRENYLTNERGGFISIIVLSERRQMDSASLGTLLTKFDFAHLLF